MHITFMLGDVIPGGEKSTSLTKPANERPETDVHVVSLDTLKSWITAVTRNEV